MMKWAEISLPVGISCVPNGADDIEISMEERVALELGGRDMPQK
jgi:hypothetical protein